MKAQITLEFLFNFLILLVFINFLFLLLLDFHQKLRNQEELIKSTIETENLARLEDVRISAEPYKNNITNNNLKSTIENEYKGKTIIAETLSNFTIDDRQHI